MTKPIRSFEIDGPTHSACPESRPPLSSAAFNEEVNRYLEEGYRNNHSKDYVTDQILKYVQANPEAAFFHFFPKDYRSIKERIVEPYYLRKEIEAYIRERNQPEIQNLRQVD